MEVQYLKAGTVTTLALSSGAAVFAAAYAATTVATVAYAILAVGVGSMAIASITAALDETSTDRESYFFNIKKHAIVTIPASFSVVGQVMIQSLIRGIADGLGDAVYRKFNGDKIRSY